MHTKLVVRDIEARTFTIADVAPPTQYHRPCVHVYMLSEDIVIVSVLSVCKLGS